MNQESLCHHNFQNNDLSLKQKLGLRDKGQDPNKIKYSQNQIPMQSQDEEQNSNNHQSNRSRLVNFKHKAEQNPVSKVAQKLSLQSHKADLKINRPLRKSLAASYKINEELLQKKVSPRRKTFVLDYKKSKIKQQILSIPKFIANIDESQNHPEKSFQHRKLFLEEEDFMKELKKKANMYSYRNKNTDSFAEKPSQNYQQAQIPQIKPTHGKQIIKVNEQSFQLYNRTKTMQAQKQEKNNKIFFSAQKKDFLFSNKEFKKDNPQNFNKFYQKFENYCKIFQKEATRPSKSKFKSVPLDPHQQKETQISKDKFQSRRDLALSSKYSSGPQKQQQRMNEKTKQNEIKEKQQLVSVKQHKKSNLLGENIKKLKVMIKSNSNNQGFKKSKYINIPLLKQSNQTEKQRKNSLNSSQKSIKIIDFTSYQIKKEDKHNQIYLRKGQRIHHSQAGKQPNFFMSETKRKNKQGKQLRNERSMKISNNMNIVLKDNNRTRINIFHNSLLLKEDPQKVEALMEVVQGVSQRAKRNKIKVPFQLQINKLKIQQKSNLDSERNCQKQINRQIDQIVKKVKEKRKQGVPRIRTEKKCQIRMQGVEPWDIHEQIYTNEFQNPQFLDESLFSYSKTID